MVDGKELKPKSFRIDDETAEKIKAIASHIGGNQQQAFIKLIEAYEFQSSKTAFHHKKEDIEKFEKHINIITRLYMNSLEDSQCMEDTVRTEFDALLKSKDTMIQDLQKREEETKKSYEKMNTALNVSIAEKEHLNTVIIQKDKEYTEKLENMKIMLEDKEKLNKALTNTNTDLKAKAAVMEAKAASAEETEKQLTILQKEADKLKQSLEQSTKEKLELKDLLEQERIKHKQELTLLNQHEKESLHYAEEQYKIRLDKATLKLEQECQQQITELNTKNQEEIAAYLQKYSDLMEKNNDYIRQISEIKAELNSIKNFKKEDET